MVIENLFGSIKTVFKNELHNERIAVPSVIFLNYELQVAIGQWLGILTTENCYKVDEIATYIPNNREVFDNRVNDSREKEKEIAFTFGKMLTMIGFDSEDCCILGDFNKMDFSFDCCFRHGNESVKISLSYGNASMSNKFVIDYHDVKRIYDVCKDMNGKVESLKLQAYTVRNSSNGQICHRHLSSNSTCFVVNNGEYRLTIQIGNVDNVNHVANDNVFWLDNEEGLQENLLNLSFPVNVISLYKKICKSYVSNFSEYDRYLIQLEEKKDDKFVTTNMISLKNGELKKFVVTKEGKIITIEGDNNWSFGTPNMTISEVGKGDIQYSLNVKSYALCDIKPFQEDYAIAKEAVKKEQRKIKTLLKEIKD